jgi:hypothetical protein
MPFAPVKSDPWARRGAKRKRRFDLWSEEFWKRLVKRAEIDGYFNADEMEWVPVDGPRVLGVSDDVADMIRDANELLYGRAAQPPGAPK